MKKKWQGPEKYSPDFEKKFPEFSPTVLQLLYNRDLNNQKKIDEFFNPDYSQDLFDPFLLKNMDKAVQRISQAYEKKERVAIFGDYDADGVTSSVLLMELFRDILGLRGQVYIPERVSEGYGMNKKAIDWLSNKEIDLIITCDCGASNKEEIDYAKSLGMDVIVTDHHNLPHEFSDEYIIIDPRQKDDKYPYKELAGVGIAFKLAQAVLQSKNKFQLKNFKDGYEKKFLDLVAIGTIADCSQLLSENRTLVKYGLEVLKNSTRVGLKYLMDVAGVDTNNISTYSVGFYIAPRINAAGRLDHANVAYKLLSIKDQNEANNLARRLQSSNIKRQKLTDDILKEAKSIIGEVSDDDKLIAVAGPDWPIGVVGIVAGRLSEEYHRPALVAGKGKNESVGSARSIENFNVIEAISENKNILLEYGGHKQAAGFSVENKNLNKFFGQIKDKANKIISKKDLVPVINFEYIINIDNVDWELYDDLKLFEPSGMGNVKPLFQINNVKIDNIFHLGKEKKHLKIEAKVRNHDEIEILGFNMGGYLEDIKKNGIVDIIAEIELNEWNGHKKIQLIMRDYKKSHK